MAAKDRFHDAVQRALEKDGWTIVKSPFKFKFGQSGG
jgi:XisH protein